MTPALSAVYDELLARASAPDCVGRARALRDAFVRRTCSVLPSDGSAPEDRVRAAWDEALTQGGLAAELAPNFEDAAERALARVLSRAHRGLFRMGRLGSSSIATDLVSGASFVVLPRDDVAREVTLGPDAPLFEARIVAAADGCAALPGVIFHPPDAGSLIEAIVGEGRQRGMARDDLCDALLRMQHTFSTLSRVKIAYAYKVEALATAPPSPPARI